MPHRVLPEPEPKASLKMLTLQGRVGLTHSSIFPIVLAVQPDTGLSSLPEAMPLALRVSFMAKVVDAPVGLRVS